MVMTDEEKTGFRVEVAAFVKANLPTDIAEKGRLGRKFVKQDHVRWQKILYEKGWFAASWPVEHRGAGWAFEKQLIFAQESAIHFAPMIIPYGVSMVGPVLYTFGTEEQKEKFLPGILSSDTWWCQGYSEPNSGSDLASLKMSAVRDGDDFVINGSKMWTTEAHWADMMHCLVRTSRTGKPQAGISFLLIDMKTPGITVTPIITIDGIHHTNQVFFDEVRVPVKNLVGEENQGWAIAKFLLSHERVAIADTGAKIKLLRDIKNLFRKNCETGLISKTLRGGIAVRLGALEADLCALLAMEERYVRAWSDGASLNGPEASVLKVRGTEILQHLSEIALEIEGPLGAVHDPDDLYSSAEGWTVYKQASALAHQYLYGRCWSIFGGANEIQRNIIAGALLR